MSAFFNSASTTYLVNAATTLTGPFPFSLGLWVQPTTTGATKTFWSLCDTAATGNRIALSQSTANAWVLSTVEAGVGANNTNGTVVAGLWTFIILRMISATNRRIAIINDQGVSSKAPAGLDSMSLGVRKDDTLVNYFDGGVAEFWYTNTDIQEDGGVLSEATFRQLAYGGPFSIPSVASTIVEYHSFKKDLGSDQFTNEDDFLSNLVAGEVLANNGGVILGPHPPLPYWYVRPGQVKRQLVI